MEYKLGPRRSSVIDITQVPPLDVAAETPALLEHLESFDLVYRSLCALLYNYVPMSGHPGGSISSGRFVEGLVFGAAEYDLGRPDREDADVISYAAGHKALGLYAMWALRDELARIAAPDLLPGETRLRLRLEDLLGFRRNPITSTPLFAQLGAKALDGHPTPATPFVRLATGASGVGVASSIGLALAARDVYGDQAPRFHVVEGEGGLTPGRVAEALAAAGTASLGNVVFHVDWNQASIDSNKVCREGATPGDYVQWDPIELFHLHDWNVVYVPDGKDFRQVLAAQRQALAFANGQPTAVVYRTVKGWQYGIEGRASHGAGHKQCSEGFYRALSELTGEAGVTLPTCEGTAQRCVGVAGAAVMEQCLWEALLVVRQALEARRPAVEALAARLSATRDRLDGRRRRPRSDSPRIEVVFETARGAETPAELRLAPGAVTTLRGELGRALGYLNRASGGSFLLASADLLGSTSVNVGASGFPEGYWNALSNPGARLLSVGGICEDAIAGVLSGISTFGHHIGVGSSYGAFLAPLGHIAARLHAIGGQARRDIANDPYRPMILVCAHAGLKTGEDGPTHADPQPLQLLQENFPRGTAVTLTPWDPLEIWPSLTAALRARPALIAPFVTRPNETVLDREALGLAPPEAAAAGLYVLHQPRGKADVTLVLQESAVTYAFVTGALPRLEKDGIDPLVYSVSSAELFDLLPPEEQARIFPEASAMAAMGITGFTLATMYRWVRSDLGRSMTLHPFHRGHFLGSGPGHVVLEEAGLDGEGQYRSIRRFLDARSR
jgi:transketolase